MPRRDEVRVELAGSCQSACGVDLTFFRMSTLVLVLLLVLLVGGAAAAGNHPRCWLRTRPEPNHQPVGVVQAALLGLIGLVLAFGLTMAVGRYDNRRAIVVQEANDIDTTFLRAELLAEPSRTMSLDLLRQMPTGRSTWPIRCRTVTGSATTLSASTSCSDPCGATPATWSVLIRWGLRHASTSTRSTR